MNGFTLSNHSFLISMLIFTITFMLLVFFPSPGDSTKVYTFYQSNYRVQALQKIDAERSAATVPTNRTYNEDTGTFEDVPITDATISIPTTVDEPTDVATTSSNVSPARAIFPCRDGNFGAYAISCNPDPNGTVSGVTMRPSSFERGNTYSDHTGTDILLDRGSAEGSHSRFAAAICASKPGVVVKAATGSTGYGNHVWVVHPDKTATCYAHFVKAPAVQVGQTVQTGTLLGYQGMSGNATGVHLHYETRTLNIDYSLQSTSPSTLYGYIWSTQIAHSIDNIYIPELKKVANMTKFYPAPSARSGGVSI